MVEINSQFLVMDNVLTGESYATYSTQFQNFYVVETYLSRHVYHELPLVNYNYIRCSHSTLNTEYL